VATAVKRRGLGVAVLVFGALALLGGCALPPSPEPEIHGEPAPRAWLAEPGEPLALDAGRSRISLRVYRAGRLARLGHNHVVEASAPAGEFRRLADGGGLAQLRIDPRRLRVDDPAARARYGEAFAQMPDAEAVAGTRQNMLGPAVLDAAAWPQITVLARIDDLAAARPVAELHLTLRGVGRRYRVPVSVRVEQGVFEVRGALSLRQSDFGIAPFAVLGGALKVRDAVDVDFVLVGGKTAGAV
jgi:hypothetical protein